MWRSSTALILALAFGGCGGGNETGGGPTTPSATTTALVMSPATDLLKIKASETFAVSATMSDGSTRPVQATWNSDASSVAAVDGGGRASGVSPGEATIFADYEGFRATRRLRVVPDYQGRWNGDYRVATCNSEGDWRGFCDQFEPADLFLMALVLTQNRDATTGTVDLGELPGPVQGAIRISGHLTLTGTYSVVLEGVPVEVGVSNWETLSIDNERMSGRFTVSFRAAGLSGSAQLASELRIVAKTAASAAGRSVGAAALRQALSRVVRRR